MRRAFCPMSYKAKGQMQTGNFAEVKLTRSSVQNTLAKSLRSKILPVSLAFPRFCAELWGSPATDPNETKNLGV
jgi:hypothetical protein